MIWYDFTGISNFPLMNFIKYLSDESIRHCLDVRDLCHYVIVLPHVIKYRLIWNIVGLQSLSLRHFSFYLNISTYITIYANTCFKLIQRFRNCTILCKTFSSYFFFKRVKVLRKSGLILHLYYHTPNWFNLFLKIDFILYFYSIKHGFFLRFCQCVKNYKQKNCIIYLIS